MDIFFDNPDDPPQPPEKMEIRSLTADPYEDGRRVAVEIGITPFQQAPNMEITVTNSNGQQVSLLSVVEANEKDMAFTLHLREQKTGGSYTLKAELFYTDLSVLEDPEATIKDIQMARKPSAAVKSLEFTIPA